MSSLWKKKADFRSKKKGKVGPKKIDRQVFRAAVRETSWEDRTTLRRLAAITKISSEIEDGSDIELDDLLVRI